MEKQIEEAARKYALQTTHTRCAYMGTEDCKTCKNAERGRCDFRSRREAFIQGVNFAHNN